MKNIYAFVDYGAYEDYGVVLIKVSEEDKDKFKDFCEDARKFIDWEKQIIIQAWIENIELEKESSLKVLTIQEYQNKINNDLELELIEIESSDDRDKLIELLKYEFITVEK